MTDDEETEILTWLQAGVDPIMVEPDASKFPHNLDANLIFGKLYQGAAPPTGTTVANAGFQVLVLCADEYQPKAEEFPGVEVIRMPSDDYSHVPPTESHRNKVRKTAEVVAARLDENKAVLVTCFGGYNRSGLVTGYSLHLHLGWDGEKIVWWIRSKRDFALHNRRFAGWLSELPAKGSK